MHPNYEIETCRCDSCEERNVGIMYLHYGSPVLFVCRDCQPKQFTEYASAEVFCAVLESLFGFDSCATNS